MLEADEVLRSAKSLVPVLCIVGRVNFVHWF